MLQQHTVLPAKGELDHAEQDSVLRFDAVSALRAIVFHVLDEHLAKRVAAGTIRRTLDRLANKSFTAAITRRRWVSLTNPQRLKWLLTETRTTMVANEGHVVMLRARRGG